MNEITEETQDRRKVFRELKAKRAALQSTLYQNNNDCNLMRGVNEKTEKRCDLLIKLNDELEL